MRRVIVGFIVFGLLAGAGFGLYRAFSRTVPDGQYQGTIQRIDHAKITLQTAEGPLSARMTPETVLQDGNMLIGELGAHEEVDLSTYRDREGVVLLRKGNVEFLFVPERR